MKRIVHIAASFLGFLSLASVAFADLRVSLRLDPVSAMASESVTAYVSVLNDGENDFVLDSSDKNNKARALFVIERKSDETVDRISGHPPVSKMRLAPGEKQEFLADISLLYDIATKGRYVVRAAIEVGDVRYESNPVILDVVRGIEIASISRYVPGYPERVRKYSLRYHGRDKRELLFLCVDEDNGNINCGTFSLGPVVRVVKPTLDLDRNGNIKVTHQTNRDCFICSKFESNRDGVFFIDQSYFDYEGKPYKFVQEKPSSPKK